MNDGSSACFQYTVSRPIRYTEWRTKNLPAVSYTSVDVGLGLCTGN